MNILETKKLTYSYDGKQNAISDVDIAIPKGSITAILGGNGAGKSTLFLNLNGVLKAKSGEVYFDEKKVSYDAKGIKELRRHIGIVFQDPNDQLFSASVKSDIAFGAKNLGYSDEEVRTMVAEVAAQTGVTEFIDKPTHALSFGQKKRVAIAGVLIMKPEVVILDEPTAGLDPAGVSEILKLLMEIKERTGISVIISTHDIDIVPLYCDYAYIMDKGRVVAGGTPRELFLDAKQLRSHSLRMPRIAHLMEILHDKDHLPVDMAASTISGARSTIKELLQSDE